MPTKELLADVLITQAITATNGAAGTSAINGAIIDMSGYEGVLVIVNTGAITSGAVTSIKMQQDTASAMGGAADLLGTSQTIADTDDEDTFVIDLFKPQERYVRLVVSRATQNAVISAATYIRYGARTKPVTSASATINVESHIGVAEGTA